MVVRVSDTMDKHSSQSFPQPVNDHSFCLVSLGLATASFVHMLSFPWWRSMLSGQILLESTLILFFFTPINFSPLFLSSHKSFFLVSKTSFCTQSYFL